MGDRKKKQMEPADENMLQRAPRLALPSSFAVQLARRSYLDHQSACCEPMVQA